MYMTLGRASFLSPDVSRESQQIVNLYSKGILPDCTHQLAQAEAPLSLRGKWGHFVLFLTSEIWEELLISLRLRGWGNEGLLCLFIHNKATLQGKATFPRAVLHQALFPEAPALCKCRIQKFLTIWSLSPVEMGRTVAGPEDGNVKIRSALWKDSLGSIVHPPLRKLLGQRQLYFQQPSFPIPCQGLDVLSPHSKCWDRIFHM